MIYSCLFGKVKLLDKKSRSSFKAHVNCGSMVENEKLKLEDSL